MSLKWRTIVPHLDEPDYTIQMATYKQVRIEKYPNGMYFTIDARFTSQQACMDRINAFWEFQNRKPGR